MHGLPERNGRETWKNQANYIGGMGAGANAIIDAEGEYIWLKSGVGVLHTKSRTKMSGFGFSGGKGDPPHCPDYRGRRPMAKMKSVKEVGGRDDGLDATGWHPHEMATGVPIVSHVLDPNGSKKTGR